jgi:hypothetical protein
MRWLADTANEKYLLHSLNVTGVFFVVVEARLLV